MSLQQGSTDVSLTVFGGANTEMIPSVIPEGGSPYNNDVAFLPGSVSSRPCLHLDYVNGFPVGDSAFYKHTFTNSLGIRYNMILTGFGNLYWESLSNPTVLTSLTQISPFSFGKFASYLGSEYMAFSDGRHGCDMPRQWDGVNLDRYTTDGPGANPCTVADSATSVVVTSVTVAVTVAITASPNGAFDYNGVLTYVTTAPHGIAAGDYVTVFGVGVIGYNLTQAQVVSVPSTTTFTLVGAAVLAASGGGAVRALTATVTLATASSLIVGDQVVITGSSVGQYNNNDATTASPPYWTVYQIISPTQFTFNCLTATSSTAGAGGSALLGGLSVPGIHKMVVIFETRNGYLTKPSPPISFVTVGGKKLLVGSIPTGPPCVSARILAFTGAGGAYYFGIFTPGMIPDPITGALTPVSTSTRIPDNTTTSFTVDFSDNTLFAGLSIDINGSNLFRQVKLPMAAAVFAYSKRLAWWGLGNVVTNFVNTGFDGGPGSGVPLGWTNPGGNGALVAKESGWAWRMIGNVGMTAGGLMQPAYQDYLGAPILSPNVQYGVKFLLNIGSVGILPPSVQFAITSASMGQLAVCATVTAKTGWNCQNLSFSAALPAILPSDLMISVCGLNVPVGTTVDIDELEFYPLSNPYVNNRMFMSYAGAIGGQEQIDGTTGVLGPAADSTQILDCFILRNTLYMITEFGLHQTNDNGTTEPAGWEVDQQASNCGGASLWCSAIGEDMQLWVGPVGLMIFDGGSVTKVSQEVQTLFDQLLPSFGKLLWVANDYFTRRIYIGGNTLFPSAPVQEMLVLDYRELNSGSALANSPPVHASAYSGKLIATDVVRKWSIWNIPNAFGALCYFDSISPPRMNLCVLGATSTFWLDPAKYTDDTGNVVAPYWISYFFCTHDQEQQFQLGAARKAFFFMTMFVSGIGNITVTPLRVVVSNPDAANAFTLPLSQNPTFDLERNMNVLASRCAFKFSSTPLPGQTDNQFSLSHFSVSVKIDPNAPLRGVR